MRVLIMQKVKLKYQSQEVIQDTTFCGQMGMLPLKGKT
jgi:hypothetical protein